MKKQAESNFLWRNILRVAPYAKPYFGRICLFMFLVLPLGGSDVLITWGLKRLIDSLRGVEQVVNTVPFVVWLLPVMVIAFAVIQGLLQYFAAYLNAWIGNKVANDIKVAMFKKLLSLDPVYFDMNNSGNVLFRYYNDPELACRELLTQLKDLLTRSITVVSLAVFLFHLSWRLAIVSLFMLTLTMLPLIRLRKKIAAFNHKIANTSSQLITSYNETFRGIKTILAYNLQFFQLKRLQLRLTEFFNLQMSMTQRIAWLPSLMHIITAIGIGITVGYGTFLVLKQSMTLGSLVSFATSLFIIYNPIKAMGCSYASLQQAMFAVDRVFEILNLQPKLKDSKGATTKGATSSNRVIFQQLEFQEVSFCYTSSSRLILDKVSFRVSVGETVALVGNSGGGKTTITNLLMRFYDVNQGSIKINGIDLREWPLEELRKQIAVVFQDNFLFDGSVADNLLVGKRNASEVEMWEALEQAYLRTFVEELPEGLQTSIGEYGVLLSGGQKQRLAIARAFLKDAPVIILDEATSALDNQTESIVQQAIYNLTKRKTVLVIAHRLSTVQHADQILVIQKGKIVERGNHQKLLSDEQGVYRQLYQSQFR